MNQASRPLCIVTAPPRPQKGRERAVPSDANAHSEMMRGRRLLVVEVAVAGQDVALELFLVGVPELGGLGVQRARTGCFCQFGNG